MRHEKPDRNCYYAIGHARDIIRGFLYGRTVHREEPALLLRVGDLRYHLPHLRLHVRPQVLRRGLLHPGPGGVRLDHRHDRLGCHGLLLGLRRLRPPGREPGREDRSQEDSPHRGPAAGGRRGPRLHHPRALAPVPVLGGDSGHRSCGPLRHPDNDPLKVLRA